MSLINQFLGQIRQHVRGQRGDLLRSWLQVEPGSAKQYFDLKAELQSKLRDPAKLEKVVETGLPQDDDVADGEATSWPGLLSFIKDYFIFWRDVNFDDLLGAHQLLSGLVKYERMMTVLRSNRTAANLNLVPVPLPLRIPRTAVCFCKRACRCRRRWPG